MQRILTLFLILLSFGFNIPPKVEKRIDKEIASCFEIKSFTKNIIQIDKEVEEQLPLRFNQSNFKSIHVDNELIGYFYYGSAPSKTDEFDYVVILDQEKIIKKIKILAYREDYGGEISSNRWLKQFYNLDHKAELTFESDIKSISGATISARSMTVSVNQLLQSLRILQEKNLL